MNRSYTLEQYLEKVALFKELVPNIALGTDIIVGFPTETDADFEATVVVLKQIEYSMSFIFTYSPRKGTPSTRWVDDVPESVKDARLQQLLDLQDEINARQRQELLGQTVEVLVERQSGKDKTLVKGRTRCWKNVAFPGDASLIGSLQQVTVHSYSHETLMERVLEKGR